MTAQERLTLALVHMAAEGGRPPCGDHGSHDLWTSDDHTDREIAAARCLDCPLIAECGAASDEADEHWHVWAGVDRTPARSRAAAA